MKGQPRTNEEKAYLVLQHLYELATDKDPTGRNPYRMEQEIIHHGILMATRLNMYGWGA